MWSFDAPVRASMDDVQVRVAGAVGEGGPDCVLTIARGLTAAGWSVLQANDAPAQVRGGHTFQTLRARRDCGNLHAPRRGIDILVSLSEGAFEPHEAALTARSALVARALSPSARQRLEERGTMVLPLPPAARDDEPATSASTAASTVLSLLDARPVEAPPTLLLSGNEAVAYGALVAGCRFVGLYPMTPATSIAEWLAARDPALGVSVVSVEDEIAAATMSLGAAYTGARAMTVTSGAGLALMAESVGFAGMAEIPLVIVDAQRPGPSTGMPTRTEQGDLLFAIHIHHAEAPHIVLAPGDVAECFELTARAFNLAERYQCPVIVLTDGHLATLRRTVVPSALDPARVHLDRGAVGVDATAISSDGAPPRYERYGFTLDGISPRAWPGDPRGVHTASSYEHDPRGHIDESAANRSAAVDRRTDRLELARAEARGPRRYGPAAAEVTLLTWGSTTMACREAVDLAAAQGLSLNMLQFTDLWPFPKDATWDAMREVQRAVLVEQNSTGQLGALLRCEARIEVPAVHLRYDGRPITPEEILERAVPAALGTTVDGASR
ncbi:MAG: 2-oxoacid:acceptor oxidoreductase subunit alpha [Dehalococcoidia bacterium]|nr:2-oxoacid:acceptor oxidoreductase subunit alpha [Dehalococcoidia bacterium]